MLVLNFKKRNCIEVKETNKILSVVGVFGSNLILKLYENSNGKTHSLIEEIKCPIFKEIDLGNGLTVRHISGKGKNMQIGFKGSATVVRMPSKFKIKERKEPNFNFDFDTEGY